MLTVTTLYKVLLIYIGVGPGTEHARGAQGAEMLGCLFCSSLLKC